MSKYKNEVLCKKCKNDSFYFIDGGYCVITLACTKCDEKIEIIKNIED